MPTTRTRAGGDATSANESKVDVAQIIAELQQRVQELGNELNAQRVETTQAKADAAAARSAALSSPSRSRTSASQVVVASSPPSGPKIREYLATITGKFNDHNWLAWSKETKTFLKIHNLWRGVIDRPDRTDVTFDQKNLNAYLIIKAGVEDHIGQQVRSIDSAADTWKFLQPRSDIHIVHAKRQELAKISIGKFKSASMYLGAGKALFDEITE